jgi:DNA-binding transcriptional MerR regulator
MTAKPALKPIPDKLYFPIREVAELTGVETYVLRFWEKEFPMLQPVKESSGHRRYRRKDIEMVLQIKHLLYDEGFTIPGARTALQKGSAPATLFAVPPAPAPKRGGRGSSASLAARSPEEMLRRVRAELGDLLTLLK